jgi:hypothetical protein
MADTFTQPLDKLQERKAYYSMHDQGMITNSSGMLGQVPAWINGSYRRRDADHVE